MLVDASQLPVTYYALYSRRKDYVATGLTYTVEFSANLVTYVASTDTPTVRADNGTLEVVAVPFPGLVNGQPPHFFHIIVTQQ